MTLTLKYSEESQLPVCLTSCITAHVINLLRDTKMWGTRAHELRDRRQAHDDFHSL